MPSELRHILFRPAEVVQAVREYQRRAGAPLPPGLVARCGPEAEGAGVRFRIAFAPERAKGECPHSPAEGEGREVVIQAPVLAAALILHCRDRRIPLPAGAEKWLTRHGEQVCLVANIKRGVSVPVHLDRVRP